jgi:hypothetical protein
MPSFSFENLTCFLAAEHSAERSRLRQQLEERKVTCLSVDRTSARSGSSVSTQSLIQRSDFVVGILPPSTSQNIAFELGIALGLGKPVLLFAHKSSQIPFDLAALNVLPIDRLEETMRDHYIEAFLRTITPSKHVAQKAPARRDSNWARRLREIRVEYAELLEKRGASFGQEFEHLVERAFKKAGFLVSGSPEPDFGADLALASPKLSEAFTLPILIEVKDNSRKELSQAVIDRLSALIADGRGGAGLVVTSRPHEVLTSLELDKPIVIAPFSELLDWLRKDSFEEEFLNVVDTFWSRER